MQACSDRGRRNERSSVLFYSVSYSYFRCKRERRRIHVHLIMVGHCTVLRAHQHATSYLRMTLIRPADVASVLGKEEVPAVVSDSFFLSPFERNTLIVIVVIVVRGTLCPCSRSPICVPQAL